LTFTSPPSPHGDGYVQPCEEVGMEVSHTHCFLILSDLILYYNTITRLTFTSPPPPHGDGYVQPCEEVGMEVSHAHCFLILSDLILYYNTTTVPWTRWVYTLELNKSFTIYMSIIQTQVSCANPGFYVRGCTCWRGVWGPPRSPSGPGHSCRIIVEYKIR
jgi:hypothetical protein